MTFRQIPIVDMSRQDPSLNVAQSIRDVCHNVGFFYVTNHGVDDSLCTSYLDATKRFFALAEKEKQRIHKKHSPHFRGWEQLGSELTNNEIDYREQLDIGAEREALSNPDPHYMRLVGPNQWPHDDVLPGFRDTITDYMKQMEKLARKILGLLSNSLGLDAGHIEHVFGQDPMPYCKLICYPITPGDKSGVGAHKDAGFLSLLLQDEIGGLQAQNSIGEWIDVAPIPGTFAINLGEMLQIMTQNYYVATPHRVVNRNAGRKRYSMAYFYNPDLNTRLELLPIADEWLEATQASAHHASAGLMASADQMNAGIQGMEGTNEHTIYGYKYWERWVRSYPDIARKHYPEQPA